MSDSEQSVEEQEAEMHRILDAKAQEEEVNPFQDILDKIKDRRDSNNEISTRLRNAGVQVHPLQLFAVRLDMLAATALGEEGLYKFELDFEEAAAGVMEAAESQIARAKLTEGLGAQAGAPVPQIQVPH